MSSGLLINPMFLVPGVGMRPLFLTPSAPEAPLLTLAAASDRGALDDDGITNETQPLLNFDAAYNVGDTITLYDGVSTHWTHVITLSDLNNGIDTGDMSAFSTGTHNLTATTTRNGLESDPSDILVLDIDTSIGAASAALDGGGLTTYINVPVVRVTCAGAVANDTAYVNRASDGFVLGTKTWDASDVTNGYADIQLSELPVGDTLIDCGVYGTASGSGADTFSANAQVTLTITAFLPSVLPDAEHWFASDDEASITHSSGNVTEVADKIGALVLEDYAGVDPVTGVTANDINGLNTIRFFGSLNSGLVEADFPAASEFSFYMPLSIDGVDSANDAILSMRDTVTTSNLLHVIANHASQFNGSLIATGGTTQAFTGGPYSGLVIFGLEADAVAGTLVARINNNVVATMSDFSDLFTAGIEMRLGIQIGSGAGLDMRLGEPVWCGAVLNAADRAMLHSYFSDKWNVQ